MPPRKSSKSNNKPKSRRSGNSVDSTLMNLAKATGSLTEVIRSDLSNKRQNFNLVQSPPRNFLTMTYWVRQSQSVGLIASSVTAVSENNFSFTLATLTNISSYTSIFDQYCIYSVTMTLAWGSVNPSSGASTQAITVYSALDYDNTTNTGISGIEQFSSFNESIITPSSSVVRMVKPCVALAAYTGAFTGFTTSRMWLDCNSTTVVHYGIRTILGISSVAVNVQPLFSYVIGFRNSHG